MRANPTSNSTKTVAHLQADAADVMIGVVRAATGVQTIVRLPVRVPDLDTRVARVTVKVAVDVVEAFRAAVLVVDAATTSEEVVEVAAVEVAVVASTRAAMTVPLRMLPAAKKTKLQPRLHQHLPRLRAREQRTPIRFGIRPTSDTHALLRRTYLLRLLDESDRSDRHACTSFLPFSRSSSHYPVL